MKQIIEIDDIPPNLNEVISMTKRHWGAYYSQKKKWSNAIISYCKLFKLKPMQAPIKVTLQNIYPTNRRRDPDNIICKFLLDGIVEAGVLPDDSFKEITEIVILKPKIEKGTKKTIITLEDGRAEVL